MERETATRFPVRLHSDWLCGLREWHTWCVVMSILLEERPFVRELWRRGMAGACASEAPSESNERAGVGAGNGWGIEFMRL